MALYGGSINGVALSTTLDLKTLVTTASGAGSVVRVQEIFIAGEAGSTVATRIAVNRPSTNGTTPTAQVPEKFDPASPAATFTFASTWTTQPTLSTNDVLVPTFNAFGGGFKWQAPPDGYIVVGGQGAIANLSIRSRLGIPSVSGHIVMEER